MGHLWRDLNRTIEGMESQEWMLVLIVVIVIGFFCMRGFGSRSDY